MRIVGAEKCRVLPVLFEPCRYFLQYELLGTGHSHVAYGVRSRLKMKLQAYIVACRFHNITPSGQQLIAHVSWE